MKKETMRDKMNILPLYAIILCWLITGVSSASEKQGFTLVVNWKEGAAGDSLTLSLADGIFTSYNRGKQIKGGRGATGQYVFHVRSDEKFGYFYLFSKRKRTYDGGTNETALMMDRQLWEQGDSVILHISHRETRTGIYATYLFKGKGALKYTAYQEALSVETRGTSSKVSTTDLLYKLSDRQSRGLTVLERYRKSISNLAYEYIKADLLFLYKSAEVLKLEIQNAHTEDRSKWIDLLKYPPPYKVNNEAIANNGSYLAFMIKRYQLLAKWVHPDQDQMKIVTELIMKENEGLVRDRLLAYMCATHGKRYYDQIPFGDFLEICADPLSKAQVGKVQGLSAKRIFPNYTFETLNEDTVSLRDYEGKVVLIDFWFVGCGYCALFYRNTLNEIEKEFEDNNQLVFLSVCTDKTKKRWEEGLRSGEYSGAGATNVTTSGIYHPILTENNIREYPTVILLNKKRELVAFNSSDLYDTEKLREKLSLLIAE